MAEPERKGCFVIGPIGSSGSATRKDADFVLKGIIRPALTKIPNLMIWRADEDNHPGMITDKVINDIYDADLVVADLSELNPNAFYELGIRHAAAKPVIHIAAIGTKLPFDNLGHRAILFDKTDWDSIENAKVSLYEQARIAVSDNFQPTNPVTQALSIKAFRASAAPGEQVLAELMSRLENLEIKAVGRGSSEISREDQRYIVEIYEHLMQTADDNNHHYEIDLLWDTAQRIAEKYPKEFMASGKFKDRERLYLDLLKREYIPF